MASWGASRKPERATVTPRIQPAAAQPMAGPAASAAAAAASDSIAADPACPTWPGLWSDPACPTRPVRPTWPTGLGLWSGLVSSQSSAKTQSTRHDICHRPELASEASRFLPHIHHISGEQIPVTHTQNPTHQTHADVEPRTFPPKRQKPCFKTCAAPRLARYQDMHGVPTRAPTHDQCTNATCANTCGGAAGRVLGEMDDIPGIFSRPFRTHGVKCSTPATKWTLEMTPRA